MNYDDLNAEIARCGLSIPKLADKIGIGKKALYSRMRGETSFNQAEIAKISKVLNLDGNKILSIFFNSQVS